MHIRRKGHGPFLPLQPEVTRKLKATFFGKVNVSPSYVRICSKKNDELKKT